MQTKARKLKLNNLQTDQLEKYDKKISPERQR